MSDELPEEIKSWIGQERYQEKGEFPVERGYIWTTCASVENGNPLYWDDSLAEEITDGPIAMPTMISKRMPFGCQPALSLFLPVAPTSSLYEFSSGGYL